MHHRAVFTVRYQYPVPESVRVREGGNMVAIERVFGERIGSLIGELTGKIRSINQRYANPKIKLFGRCEVRAPPARLYLIFLVGLLVYKFWTIIHGGS